MNIIDLAATGRNIKRLRLEAGLTVRDLQEKLGFPESGGHFQKSIVILRH